MFFFLVFLIQLHPLLLLYVRTVANNKKQKLHCLWFSPSTLHRRLWLKFSHISECVSFHCSLFDLLKPTSFPRLALLLPISIKAVLWLHSDSRIKQVFCPTFKAFHGVGPSGFFSSIPNHFLNKVTTTMQNESLFSKHAYVFSVSHLTSHTTFPSFYMQPSLLSVKSWSFGLAQ